MGMKILDTQTGVAVEVPKDWFMGNPHDNWYIWTEGNYSCDCNRALLHARWRGETEPEDLPCGEGRYELVDVPWQTLRALEVKPGFRVENVEPTEKD